MQELLSQRFEAQKQKLVSMDIVAVAESLGMTLKPGSSGIYYWEEHDSFHIYPNTNTFRWWSRGVGTNTIDLVQVVQEEMTGHKPTFREATSFLETGQFNNVTVQPVVKEPFEYYLERYEHPDFNIGRQYLKEERGLSDETIDTFLASGNLATATRKKGDYFEPVIVFKSRDNDGKMIGASLQGIVENRVQHPERGRLKQILKNSEGTAGFSLDIGTPKWLVFAEAPIDLMSYYEVNKDDLQDVKLVAMDGLKKGVVSRYVADLLTYGKYSQTMSAEQIRGALDALNQTTNLLQEHPDMITLAVDNDEAGRRFVSELQENGIPVVADLPPRQANQEKMDWNDYLKQMKKESIQMTETPEVEKQSLSESEQKWLEDNWDNITFSIERKEPNYTNQLIQEEKLAKHPYLVRLTSESRLVDGQLFRQGETVRYEEFVTALYHTRQDYQSGDEETISFDVLAPNGSSIARNFHYHLPTDTKQVSELIPHEGLQAYEQATVNLSEIMAANQEPEIEANVAEGLSLSELQESLSNEGDLVATITSDSSVIYTNTVNFDQEYSLNLKVHSPEEVDNLSDITAPWTLEVTKDNQSLGFLAYGEDWGNDFNIEDELTNLDSWVTRNQVENHLYSQEEVNSFLEPLTAENSFVEQKSLEPLSDTQKEHIREFFKTRVSDVKTDYIYLPNGQEDLGYYLDGYLFAHHYVELDMLSPTQQVDALMDRLASEDGEKMDQKFLEETFGYHPDTPIEEYHQSEKNSDRIAEKEEQDFRNQFDRQSFAETIGLMQKYSPEEVLNESNSYHDDIRYQSLLIDLGKVDTNPMYRFIERYIDRDIDREKLGQFSTQYFINIAKEHGLLNEEPSAEPWKAITVIQPVNRYTVSTDNRSKEFDNISELYQFVEENLKRPQRQELSSLLSEPGRGTPLDTLMAIDSVAGDVEVNGQSILDLFPDGINEEATEIYSRSSAEIEGTTMEPLTAEKEAVGELKSYGTFIIDDDFLERRYGSVEYDNSIRTLDSLKENAQREVTPISYEDYKQETKKFEESVKQKIASGDLSINVDDDVYAYLVFNGLGHSHPLKTVTDDRLVALHSSDIPEQLRAITEENVDAYKTKGTVEQDRLYQSLKTNQKDLGLAEVSTRLVGEMAISAYNANLRLAGLSQKGYQASYLSLFSNAIRTVIEYPYMENIETASYHTPKIIDVENKKSLEQLQETVASNSEQQKKVENPIGDLPEQSQEAAPLPSTHEEYSLNESSPTQTQSQPLLHFTISDPEKSIYKLGYHPVNKKELNKLNRYATQIQENATWYKNELADSNVTYFYKNNDNLEALKVTFKAEQYSHLVGIFAIDDDQSASKTLDDLASGKGDYQNIMVANRGATFSKIQVLPDFKAVIDSNSFIFDDLSEVERMNRLDLAKAIQTEDKDVLIAFRNVDGEYLPASLMKVTNKLESELSMANNKDVLGIIGEKDGEFKVLSVNEEAIKDGGEKMLSIVKNNQFENLSKAEVTAEDFTKVLDAVYNVGAQVGKDNRANIPEELYPAWDKYYEYAERYDNNFDVIVKAARADNLFDENSDFYKDVWLRKIQEENQKVKDSDGDGLTDDEEIALGTNPYSPDTDGDGIIDSIERGSGTDATTPSDTPDNRQKEQMNHNLALSEMIKAKDTAALNQHLQEGIKDYFDSDTYKNYLEGMAHFNHYSARNIQLIKAQLPEATMVASFEEWKKRNGHVNKGEKALYVQAPVTVIKKDADGKPVINADTGEKETLTYFKPVPVFDISQVSPVEGKELDLPKMGGAIPSQINKEYYQNVYRALRDISQKENGIPIRFRELEQSDGFYNPKTNDITIKKGMTYEQTLSTLIHEMAHSELHNNQSLAEHLEGKLTYSSEKLQAESVAYVVSNHLGFDTSNNSFTYLASWSQEPDGLENLKVQLEIVQEEASSLIKRIDKHLEKYQNLTVSKAETLTANQKRELSKATNPFYQSLQKAKEESKQVTPANEEQTKKVNRPTKQ